MAPETSPNDMQLPMLLVGMKCYAEIKTSNWNWRQRAHDRNNNQIRDIKLWQRKSHVRRMAKSRLWLPKRPTWRHHEPMCSIQSEPQPRKGLENRFGSSCLAPYVWATNLRFLY